MKKIQKIIISIACFSLLASFFISKPVNTYSASDDRLIRIALYHDVSTLSSSGSKAELQVSAQRGLIFGFFQNGVFTELHSDTSPERYTVRCDAANPYGIELLSQSGTLILSFDTRNGNFQAKPGPDNEPMIIRLGDYYRGIFEFRRFPGTGKGLLTVINEVYVEDYLYSVVPKEMEVSSPLEALKAQAVAARTYAYKYLVSPKSPYGSIGANLSDSSDSQVYYGYAQVNKVTGAMIMVEQTASNRAVDATRGRALKYNGEYIFAFYSASNGGYTEGSENVWYAAVSYLRARPDPYEPVTSSRYYWERTFTPEALRNIVLADTKNVKDIGTVTKVEILERAESGRPINIKVTGTLGFHNFLRERCRTAFSLNGQLYDVVNPNSQKDVYVMGSSGQAVMKNPGTISVMNSSGYITGIRNNSVINAVSAFRGFSNTSPEATSFTFIGRGWGHAVGMSQEGAKGMASRGFKYTEILAFYYQNTQLE